MHMYVYDTCLKAQINVCQRGLLQHTVSCHTKNCRTKNI